MMLTLEGEILPGDVSSADRENMKEKDNPVDPEGPIFVVSKSCEIDFGIKPPRSLEEIRLDLKRQRREMRRRQEAREMERLRELRRHMIAAQKEWEDRAR